jgi:hypothetical protein
MAQGSWLLQHSRTDRLFKFQRSRERGEQLHACMRGRIFHNDTTALSNLNRNMLSLQEDVGCARVEIVARCCRQAAIRFSGRQGFWWMNSLEHRAESELPATDAPQLLRKMETTARPSNPTPSKSTLPGSGVSVNVPLIGARATANGESVSS